jgi:hypothetical protein
VEAELEKAPCRRALAPTSRGILRSLASSFALASALFACGGASTRSHGSSEGPTGDTLGGSRLRPVFIESADGHRVLEHFDDTALGLSCNFQASSPESFRCVPSGAEVAVAREVVYTHPECTEPRVALSRGDAVLGACATPRYAVAVNCGGAPLVFELGPAVSAATRYRLADGVCAASVLSTDALTDLFEARPVPLQALASARVDAGVETGGVVPLDLRAEDGAALRLRFRDARGGFDCHLEGPDHDARCVPTGVALAWPFFADPSCSVQAALAPGCEALDVGFVRSDDSEGTFYYRAGRRFESGYVDGASGCVPTEQAGFVIGEPVPTEEFPAGHRTTLASGGLATTVETVGAASLPMRAPRGTAFDGYDCHFALGSDGELRCLPPPERFVDGFFADPECTARVENARGPVLAIRSAGACPPEIRVFARGEPHPGPVYMTTDGTCALAHDRPPNDGPRSPYYTFPTEIPPSDFPRVARVTR